MVNSTLQLTMEASLVAYSLLHLGRSGETHGVAGRTPRALDAKRTAVLLLGLQHAFLAPDGLLYPTIADSARHTGMLSNTLALLRQAKDSSLAILTIPLQFADEAEQHTQPVGMLAIMRAVQAFKEGSEGVRPIAALSEFGERVVEIPGRRGFDAFQHTDLEYYLRSHGIDTVVLVGAMASACVESTGRSASEKGFDVIALSDCMAARTQFEHEFYCSSLFPIYASVMDSRALMALLADEPRS